MPNNITLATIVLILYIATLGSSWKLFLSDGEGTLQNSTRIKRQDTDSGKSCTLPDHPPHGQYKITGNTSQYTPGATANNFSIYLTCAEPYVTKTRDSRTSCVGGLWSPPLSKIEECLGTVSFAIRPTTNATTTPSSSSDTDSGKSCTLPDHPPHGQYKVTGNTSQYTPGATANEYFSIYLTCAEPHVTKTRDSRTSCVGGLWSPPLSKIEECLGTVSFAIRPTTNATTTPSSSSDTDSGKSCTLPDHPPHGQYKVTGNTSQYTPGATANEYFSIYLTCAEPHVTKTRDSRTSCVGGLWSPPLSKIEECLGTVSFAIRPTTNATTTPSSSSDTDSGKSCTLPDHPPHGQYKITGNTSQYTPGATANNFSIYLTCAEPYVTKTRIPRTVCVGGLWSPPLSEIGECLGTVSFAIRPTTNATTTPSSSSESSCSLPDHPINGRFKILGTEPYAYKPYSTVHEFANLQLQCTGEDEPKSINAICFAGEWTPALINLGKCTENKTLSPIRRSRDGCTLPSNQRSGVYEKGSDKKFDVIYLMCNPGYYPRHQFHLCSNGTWYPELFECIRTCPPIKQSETYAATCVRGSSVINCNEPLEGTEVHITCNVFFEYTVIRSIPKCEGGGWSHTVSPCVPECGKRRVPAQPLVIGGQYSNKGEYPWMVGIYFGNQSHICGGSIISRYFVLSAAHCFTTYNNTIGALDPIDKTQYLVAAGKHYRSLYDERDVHKQITGLKRIYIPQYYYGIVQNYRYDYAILAVEVSFILNEYVQLVCIDWESKYETQDFKENNTAVVSGWGYTKQASSPSEELKKLQVQFKWRPSCNELLSNEFSQRYFTEDKICAGFIRQNVCKGDSGGGLYFENNHVYYVRGIVSLSSNSKVGCSLEAYALYTNVSTFLEVIKRETGLNL